MMNIDIRGIKDNVASLASIIVSDNSVNALGVPIASIIARSARQAWFPSRILGSKITCGVAELSSRIGANYSLSTMRTVLSDIALTFCGAFAAAVFPAFAIAKIKFFTALSTYSRRMESAFFGTLMAAISTIFFSGEKLFSALWADPCPPLSFCGAFTTTILPFCFVGVKLFTALQTSFWQHTAALIRAFTTAVFSISCAGAKFFVTSWTSILIKHMLPPITGLRVIQWGSPLGGWVFGSDPSPTTLYHTLLKTQVLTPRELRIR